MSRDQGLDGEECPITLPIASLSSRSFDAFNLVPSGRMRTEPLVLVGGAGRGTLASMGIRCGTAVRGEVDAWVYELRFEPVLDNAEGEMGGRGGS